MPHKKNHRKPSPASSAPETPQSPQSQWAQHNIPAAEMNEQMNLLWQPGWRRQDWPMPEPEKHLAVTEACKNRNAEIYDLEIDVVVGREIAILERELTPQEIEENLLLAFEKMHEEIGLAIAQGKAKKRERNPPIIMAPLLTHPEPTEGAAPFKWDFRNTPVHPLKEPDVYTDPNKYHDLFKGLPADQPAAAMSANGANSDQSGASTNSSVVNSAHVTTPLDGGQLPEVVITAKRIVANPRPATQSRQQVAPQQPNVYQSKKTTAHNNNSKNSSLAISQASHDHVAADMQVIADALHRMQELERVIKIEQEGIKGMNTLMYTYLGNDIGNSWNLFYSVPQLVNGFIYGDPTKPMAEQIAYELNKLEDFYNQYNEAVRDYRSAQSSLTWRLGNSDFIPVDNKTILFRIEDENTPGAKSNNQKNYLAALALLGIHGNANASERTYAVYEISINGKILKYGVADAERLTASGIPVRLAQQLSKLERVLPGEFIAGRIVESRYTTKLAIKLIEDGYVLKAAREAGIPIGNAAHIKQYVNELAILYLDERVLKILRSLRLIKF